MLDMVLLQLVLLSLLYVHVVDGHSVVESAERRLFKQLFTDYNPNVRPIMNSTQTIEVKVGYYVGFIHEVNEKHNTITIDSWFRLQWKDDYLEWNPKEYDDVKQLHISSSLVWLPDVGVTQKLDGELLTLNTFPVTIFYNGTVISYPGDKLTFRCKFHLYYFPFDKQTCVISVITWNSFPTEIQLNFSYMKHEPQVDNSEWLPVGSSGEVMVEPFGVSEVNFRLIIKRKPLYQIINTLLPFILLTVLNLFVFCIPPGAGDTVCFSVNILVALSVWQLVMDSSMPQNSDSVPLIALFSTTTIVLATVSSILTVLLVRINTKSDDEKLPTLIIWLFQLVKKNNPTWKELAKLAPLYTFWGIVAFWTVFSLALIITSAVSNS